MSTCQHRVSKTDPLGHSLASSNHTCGNRNGGATTCNFAYSGALAETVLLGNVAYRAGARLEYDAKSGRVTNNVAAAAQYLQREYRKGWVL